MSETTAITHAKSDAPVAVITAAGRGIGAGCARHLASAGYKVVLLSPSGAAETLAEELGGIGLTGSMTDVDDLSRLVRAALDAYGRIDGLVINTGILPSSRSDDGGASSHGSSYDPTERFDPCTIPDAEWQDGFDMMFLSVVRLLRLTIPVFRNQGSGAIVTISTFSAPEPRLSYPVASSVRAGLAALVKLYADRFARDGVRINSVLPGFIENWDQPEDVLAAIPMGRLGKLQDVAETVAFLLSERSGYITGQSILVDGGINRSI